MVGTTGQSIVVGWLTDLGGPTGPCRKILNRLDSALRAPRDIERSDSVGLQRRRLFRLFAQRPQYGQALTVAIEP